MTADHAGQTGGERERCAAPYVHPWGCLCCPRCGYADHPGGCATSLRPAPVPGQAAREAAVEAVALRQAVENFLLGAWRLAEDRRFNALAERITSLIELDRDLQRSALSAAGGQEQLAAVLELHQAEDVNQVGGGREPMCVECVKPSPCPTALAAGQGQS